MGRGQELKFSSLSSDDGLSQSTINCIVQDNLGFMWFGTQDGLNRYDGYGFKVYRHNPADSTSLLDKYIRCLYVDSKGTLWVGSRKGLNAYDRIKDQWDVYPVQGGAEPQVKTIMEGLDGGLWIGTNLGLYKLRKGQKECTRVKLSGKYNSFFLEADVICMMRDDKNVLWVGTDQGLYTYDKDHNEFLRHEMPEFNLPNENNEYLNKAKENIRAVYQDEKGDIWVGAKGAGLFRHNGSDNTWKLFRNIEDDPYSLSYNEVTSILEQRPGVMWIGTSTYLNTYNTAIPERFQWYRADESGEYSVSGNHITCLYKDRNDIIWIGTDGGGLSIFKQLDNQFNHFTQDNFGGGCLISNQIMGFAEDKSGALWIATFNKGLAYFDPKTGACESYPFTRNLNHNKLLSLHCDRDGLIWIGSHGGGLNYYDPEKGAFVTPYSTDRKVNSTAISQNDVLCITEDAEGNIWAGTLYGLNKFDKEKKEFTNYYTDDGLAGNFVNVLQFDEVNNKLWIGTTAGVSVMDMITGKIENMIHSNDDPESLSNNYVFCFHKDKQNNMWIGTAQGLNCYNMVTGKIKSYLQKDGLPNDNIYGILEDNLGYLWMSSNKGLIKVKPSENSDQMKDLKHYVEQDGMQSNEFNQGAYYRSKSGQMFFGGIEGFNAFFPDQIKSNTHVPPIYFTSFKLFDKEVQLDTNISVKRFIELSYKDRFFSFDFVALDYQQPTKIMYSWRLKGLEEEWKTPTHRRYATYNNLKGGDYVFQVRASNNDGLWNEKGVEIHIKVIPPFWETTWFRVLAVLVIIAGVLIFIRVRMQKIKRENKILEEKVEERTRELNEKNEEIIASITYAKRIQEAILPPRELIFKHFPNAFVLYEPKDIVSGDFYWFGVKDDLEIIAAVDCTGHGVPGAFMSMIGSNLLNQVIVENNITEPGAILTELNKRVKHALKQEDEGSIDTSDGMDLALCAVDRKKKIVNFAGAYRPLYLVRDGDVKQYKADKAPIGGGRHTTSIDFANNQIPYEDGDMIYMFSDGFPDQFGGTRGKKFMAKRFREVLLEIGDKDMREQGERLKDVLHEWQGEYEQVDDIIVIGIKL